VEKAYLDARTLFAANISKLCGKLSTELYTGYFKHRPVMTMLHPVYVLALREFCEKLFKYFHKR